MCMIYIILICTTCNGCCACVCLQLVSKANWSLSLVIKFMSCLTSSYAYFHTLMRVLSQIFIILFCQYCRTPLKAELGDTLILRCGRNVSNLFIQVRSNYGITSSSSNFRLIRACNIILAMYLLNSIIFFILVWSSSVRHLQCKCWLGDVWLQRILLIWWHVDTHAHTKLPKSYEHGQLCWQQHLLSDKWAVQCRSYVCNA